MGQKKKISALLHSDVQTADKITEMYPADWNMDAVFRKSYRKFREQAAGTGRIPTVSGPQSTVPQHRSIIFHANKWVTAACLILTAGIAGGVAWMQLAVSEPPRTVPPESAYTTAPIEEILPEHTESDPPQSDAPKHTDLTATDAKEPPHISGTQTDAQPTNSAPSESTPVQMPVPDIPQTPADVPQSTEVYTDLPQTRPTVTQTTEADPPANATLPPVGDDEPFPQEGELGDNNGSGGTVGDPADGSLPGASRLTVTDMGNEFSIAYDFEDQTHYPDPDFTVDLKGYTVTITRSDYWSSNSIANEETGVSAWALFGSGARWQSPFKYSQYQYKEVSICAQNGFTTAYLLSGETNCLLIWFDGRYLCELRTKTEYSEELFCIAAAMKTH